MRRIISVLMTAMLACTLLAGAAWADAPNYVLGDKASDFTVTTCDGETVSLYGLLEKYDAVLLNFFFNDCIWCQREFPSLNKAYEHYADKVAVLALSPYDDGAAIAEFRDEMGLSFLMAQDDQQLSVKFSVMGFPTSFLIDREGVICLEMSTSMSQRPFLNAFAAFTAEGYASPLMDYVPESEPLSLDHDVDRICEDMRRAVFDTEDEELQATEMYVVPGGEVRVRITPRAGLDYAPFSIMAYDMLTDITIFPLEDLLQEDGSYELTWQIPTDANGNGGTNLLLYADDVNVERLGIFSASEQVINEMAQGYGVTWYYE